MAATLGADLVFDVAGRRAELDQAFDAAGNIEGGRPEAGIDVHQQRNVAHVGNAADVGQDVVQGVDAQVRQDQRPSGDAAARQVAGAITGPLGQECVVGVYSAQYESGQAPGSE